MPAMPQLTKLERLELENIMLNVALEKERENGLVLRLNMVKENIKRHESNLNIWKERFNIKLKKIGLDLTKVSINADTGSVDLLSNSS